MLRETISHHIELIYPADDAHALSEKICAAFGLAPDTRTRADKPELPWSEVLRPPKHVLKVAGCCLLVMGFQ